VALPLSEAFCPAGISSFFEICGKDKAGKRFTDPAKIGSRGGGFVISCGVTSRVLVRRRSRTRIKIGINSAPAPHAQTTRGAIEQLINRNELKLDVVVDIQVKVPIAAGFGTSAAGTLASCLALCDAANLPWTLDEVGKAAHVAEVLNGTGLGTVSALMCGGFVLVKEPGAPGIGRIDRLRFPPGHSIVCAYLGPIQTKDALADKSKQLRNNAMAHAALRAIARNPTISQFLYEARKFGKQAGFETPSVTRLISAMTSAGAVGAAQNMIGEAVHAVVEDSKARRVAREVQAKFPAARVFASHLECQGVRLMPENEKTH